MPAAAKEVHPRVGGETRQPSNAWRAWLGPSPRGRGNRTATRYPGEEPGRAPGHDARSTVHPRVGGETCASIDVFHDASGPSPRGRGNRWMLTSTPTRLRSIPAWAGKPSPRSCKARASLVHPRVGGETSYSGGILQSGKGPSPRGRGNLHIVNAPICIARSIPAWAGKPRTAGMLRSALRVHPRVGGETGSTAERQNRGVGPSPRGRGNRVVHDVLRGVGGSIPAWAGKPARSSRGRSRRRVHPRVGGETSVVKSSGS